MVIFEREKNCQKFFLNVLMKVLNIVQNRMFSWLTNLLFLLNQISKSRIMKQFMEKHNRDDCKYTSWPVKIFNVVNVSLGSKKGNVFINIWAHFDFVMFAHMTMIFFNTTFLHSFIFLHFFKTLTIVRLPRGVTSKSV